MYPVRLEASINSSSQSCCVPRLSRRRGLTLAELLMAMTVTSILTVVLGGLVLAVQMARQHAEGLDAATSQAQAATDRIRFMVSHAGVYRDGGQPTMLGLAVVTQSWNTGDVPDILVVWSGGRNGGLAAAGTQNRLPRVNELVLYAPDPATSGRLVEIVVPTDSSTIDFRAADFDSRVRGLLVSADAETTRLCDRVRVAEAGGSSTTAVRFDLRLTPGDDALASVSPQSEAWLALGWAQGIASAGQGLRQATVRIEIQLERTESRGAQVDSRMSSLPFFGSASRRYVYEP